MFALCIAVTFFLPCLLAKSNPYFAILQDFSAVIIFKLSTTPGTFWNIVHLSLLQSNKN